MPFGQKKEKSYRCIKCRIIKGRNCLLCKNMFTINFVGCTYTLYFWAHYYYKIQKYAIILRASRLTQQIENCLFLVDIWPHFFLGFRAKVHTDRLIDILIGRH